MLTNLLCLSGFAHYAICLSMMKLTHMVNFTNILQAAFLYKSVLSSFSVLTFRFVIFWRKEIGAKAACKLLVKLTLVDNLNTQKLVIGGGPFFMCFKRLPQQQFNRFSYFQLQKKSYLS